MAPSLTFTPLLEVVFVRTQSESTVELIAQNVLAFPRVFTSVGEGYGRGS